MRDTIITDGGRSTSLHPNEKLDCVVRALAIASGMTYDDAHDTLKQYGRRTRCRTKNTNQILNQVVGYIPCKRSGSVGKFVESHTVGHFIVKTASHAFAVIDGQPYDMSPVRPKGRVRAAWTLDTEPKY